MIHKKLMSYCILATFLLNQSDALGMLGKNKKTEGFLPREQLFLPKLMDLKITMKLGGKDEKESVKNQWKRYIQHFQNEIEFDRPKHSLNALYHSFVKEIAVIAQTNRRLFLDLWQQQLGSSNLSTFSEFLNLPTVQEVFITLGEGTVAELQNAPKERIEPVEEPSRIIKHPKWSTMSNNKAIEILSDENVDPRSEKAKQAAFKVLGLEDEQEVTRNDIEIAYEKELQKLMVNKPQSLTEAQTQKKHFDVVNVAVEVLEERIENSSKLSDRKIANPISAEFRAEVEVSSMKIAQEIRKTGKTIEEFFSGFEFKNDIHSRQQLAYYMGYVQSRMDELSRNNYEAQILHLADVLKAVNNQAQMA